MAIILPKTNYAQAFQICDTINKEFAKREFQIEDQTIFVTFSAGIATSPPHETCGDIIKSVDQTLYRAKEVGRNRIL